MGGYGSGRHWRYDAKDTVEDCRSLDVRRLQRDGVLTPGRVFGWNWYRNEEKVSSILITTEAYAEQASAADRVTLEYKHQNRGGPWQPMKYPVQLDWTPCNYGGGRAWFLCPANGCGRRVALLYIGSAGIFACRQCYQLAYSCQRESVDDRAGRRADKVRRRLGWEPGFFNGPGWKPKGMHWETYWRLHAEHDEHVHACCMGIAKKFGFLERLLS